MFTLPVRVSVPPRVTLRDPMDLLHPVLDWSSLSQRQRWAERLCSRQARCFGDTAGCRWGGCSLFIHGQPGQQCPVFAPLLFRAMWCQIYPGSWYRQQVPPKYPIALWRQEEIKFVATQGHVPPFHRNLASVVCLLFLSQRAPPFSLWFFEESKLHCFPLFLRRVMYAR